MRQLLGLTLLAALLAGCAGREIPATQLDKANILPLALNDAFQFRKQKLAFYDGSPLADVRSEPVNFEFRRLSWGAIDNMEQRERYGNYFTFFWRATERADITARLEYRQAALGNYVMAKERYYPGARGNYVSRFEVTGDEFLEFGPVTAWRVVLIVDGRIVALRQSFIWR